MVAELRIVHGGGEIVTVLEEALALARAGELDAVGIVTVTKDGQQRAWGGDAGPPRQGQGGCGLPPHRGA
jgi:hypothetical protein